MMTDLSALRAQSLSQIGAASDLESLDALRVGMMVATFGARWQADRVFFDKRPRTTRELYNREGMELLTRDF